MPTEIIPIQQLPTLDNVEGWKAYAKELTRKADPLRWDGYDIAEDIAEDLAPHVFGERPAEIFFKNRPNEPEEIKKYRVETWEPVTQPEYQKIENVFLRVFQKGNFSITHKKGLPGMVKNEALEDFTEYGFHEYKSVLNFTTDICFRMVLGDPNGVVLYRDYIPFEGAYSQPYPFVYSSKNVLDYKAQRYLTILSNEKSEVLIGSSKERKGNVLIVALPNSTIELRQIGQMAENNYEVVILDAHNLGFIPARFFGGQLEQRNGIVWNTSFISGIVPYWNKAVQLESDFSAYKILHLFPKYVQVSIPCSLCKGSGKQAYPDGEEKNCSGCNGSKIQGGGGPFSALTLDPEKIGTLGINDMAGFVSPSGNFMTETREEIAHFIARGFSAVNMEVVGVQSANVSAEKAQLDRQDLNGTLSNVSGHMFDFLEWNYRVIAYLRYKGLFTDVQIEDEILPEVSRPVSFDFVTKDSILDEVQKAESAKLPSCIMTELHKKTASVSFGDDSDTTRKIHAEINLDPFPGLSDDGILAMNAGSPARPEDLFVHFNIQTLVQLGMEQNEGFLYMERKKQSEIVYAIAKTLMPEKQNIPII